MPNTAAQTVLGLVERFSQNVEAYRSGSYNETQVRREFIGPLFGTLSSRRVEGGTRELDGLVAELYSLAVEEKQILAVP